MDDADRFAYVWRESGASPSADQLQHQYLDPGTLGVEIFTPYRIVDAQHLAENVAEHSDRYRKAIDVCLPGARLAEPEASRILNEVQVLLGQDQSAPIFVLFGANNSGGTADERGLALGLEVICWHVDTPDQAKDAILYFVAHEVVHVFQARARSSSEASRNFLLRQALHEGFADFVAGLVLGGPGAAEKERHEYGLENEDRLWAEFCKAMDATELQPWMYGPGADGRPSDLGYWLGKRIAQAYYRKATDKPEALLRLLRLDDPHEVMRSSGYGGGCEA